MSYVDIVAEINPEAYVMDDYDMCIIGISTTDVLVYSKRLIIKQLMSEECSEEEALEWYEFNMVRALDYLGATAPVFCEEYAVTEI